MSRPVVTGWEIRGFSQTVSRRAHDRRFDSVTAIVDNLMSRSTIAKRAGREAVQSYVEGWLDAHVDGNCSTRQIALLAREGL